MDCDRPPIPQLNDVLGVQKLYDEYKQFFQMKKCRTIAEHCHKVSQMSMRLAYGISNNKHYGYLKRIANSIDQEKSVMDEFALLALECFRSPLEEIFRTRQMISAVWKEKSILSRYGQHAIDTNMLLDRKEEILVLHIRAITSNQNNAELQYTYEDDINRLTAMINASRGRLERFFHNKTRGTLFD